MTYTSATLTCDGCSAIIMNESDAASARRVAVDECGAVCNDTGDWCRACAAMRAAIKAAS